MSNIKKLFKKILPKKMLKIVRMVVLILRDYNQNTWILYKKIKIFFNRPGFPDIKNVGINIHLGCGPVNHKSFINIDGFPFPHVHYIRDISNLSVFSNNSVDLIYASHCLEHFHYSEVENVLKEWQRVLKKGGVLRLSVPDLDLLLKIYYANGANPDTIIPQLLGGQNNKYNFHYMVFNKNNLSDKLNKTGFSDIKTWIPNSDLMTTFNDFSSYLKEVNGEKFPVSLNLEAIKI